MPAAYLIASPIGNLEDITLRALRILRDVDIVFCEDTRVSARLLARHGIAKPLRALHEHSSHRALQEAISLLEKGKQIAYLSDAGTPGISDPGGKLVEHITKTLGNAVPIIPVPGPSALAAAASIAGIPMNRFLFLGYPPHKKGRKKFFAGLAMARDPAILYESSHRIGRTLRELGQAGAVPGQSPLRLVVCRELTKKFETIYRGTAEEVLPKVEKSPRGEFVIIAHRPFKSGDSSEPERHVPKER